jgi:replicative superfamily II helicase
MGAVPVQREVWLAYLAGESGLVHAATGTGKTYVAWLGPVLEALEQPHRGGLKAKHLPEPLRVLWITPLRALAAEDRSGTASGGRTGGSAVGDRVPHRRSADPVASTSGSRASWRVLP